MEKPIKQLRGPTFFAVSASSRELDLLMTDRVSKISALQFGLEVLTSVSFRLVPVSIQGTHLVALNHHRRHYAAKPEAVRLTMSQVSFHSSKV